MEIKTQSGDTIFCLPDNARCKQCGRSPEQISQCPIFNFDDYGDLCVPELCSEYTEENDNV